MVSGEKGGREGRLMKRRKTTHKKERRGWGDGGKGLKKEAKLSSIATGYTVRKGGSWKNAGTIRRNTLF